MSEAMTKPRVPAHPLMILWLLLMVWGSWPHLRFAALRWIVFRFTGYGNPLIFAACGWYGGRYKSFAFSVVYPFLLLILDVFGLALGLAAAFGLDAVPPLLVRAPFTWPTVVLSVVWRLPWPIAWLYGRRKRRRLEAAAKRSEATRVEQD